MAERVDARTGVPGLLISTAQRLVVAAQRRRALQAHPLPQRSHAAFVPLKSFCVFGS